MTPDELKALNKLSLDHVGKPLSTNPKTGLPEAGFLSSLLPTVAGIAGAAMGLPTWAVIGGVGLAATAMTGDIGQGIMAGLGAWSGGKLGADIANASTLAQSGADVGAKAFEATADSALKTTMEPFSETLGRSFTTDPTKAFMGQESFIPQGIADQAKSFVPDVATNVAQSFPQGAQAFTPAQNFASGWDAVKAAPMDFLSKPGVGMNAAMAASPALLAALEPRYKDNTVKEEENPFGLKKLSPDFKGSFPTQPNPYYTAQYPDYRAHPYGMNDGGLADVAKYAKGKSVDASRILKSGEDVMSGIEAATRRPMAQMQAQGDVGIYEDERKYAGLDPYERSLAVLKDIKKSTGMSTKRLPDLESVGTLGAINTEPALSDEAMAQQAQQQILNDYYKSAKAGGIMHSGLGDYSDGGRLLKGPGDGVSDSIPASIAGKQPARLAEGEFVIPARIVSELGNGSTDAGAKRLYAMMDRVKAKRAKAKDIAADTKAYKLLPA
jgi:hypothetical protein